MKKGAVVLIFSSLAFLISSLLFLNSSYEPKKSDVYFDLVEVNNDAEECLFLLDKVAKLSLRGALMETNFKIKDEGSKRNFLNIFRKHFRKHDSIINDVCGSPISINSYEVVPYGSKEEGFTIKGVTKNKVSFFSGNVTYSVAPHFVANIKFW